MAEKALTYAQLRDALRAELDSSFPLNIDDDFYDKAKKLLKELEKKVMENPEIYYNEWLNAKLTFQNLVKERIRKILELVYREEKGLNNLTEDEKILYKKITEGIDEFKQKVFSLQIEKSRDEEIEQGKVKIKIKKDIPLYINQETKKTYGPYEEGQIVIIEAEEAEILVKAGYAEYV